MEDTAIETRDYIIRSGCRVTENTAYFSLTSFMMPEENSATRRGAEIMLRKLSDNVMKYRGKKNIIVDLRGNGGGTLSLSEDFAWALLFDGKTSFREDNGFEKKIYSAREINSPAIAQARYNNVVNRFSVEKKWMKNATNNLNAQKANPKKDFYLSEMEYKWYKDGEPCKNDFTGNIYVLTDRDTGSASEYFCALLKIWCDDENRIKLVGENTAGRIENGGVWNYYLPNSGIGISLSDTTYVPILREFSSWHGEGGGFFPDVWCTGYDLLETLVLLTGDEELRSELDNIYSGLLF